MSELDKGLCRDNHLARANPAAQDMAGREQSRNWHPIGTQTARDQAFAPIAAFIALATVSRLSKENT
jgi:hypothetical protein